MLSNNGLHLTVAGAPASEPGRSCDAARPTNGAADYPPLIQGRCAPSNKRMQRIPATVSKLTSASTADPQHR